MVDVKATLLLDGKVLQRFEYHSKTKIWSWGPIGLVQLPFTAGKSRKEVIQDIARRLLVDVGDRLYGKDKVPE